VIVDSSPSRAAGILVFGALSTPIIVAVWAYWGTTWGLVAWGAALPLALVPWGIDATRRTIARQSSRRRPAGLEAAGSATRGASAHRRPRAGATGERPAPERRRDEPSNSSVETR
jgi:hypothetical protein